MLHESTLIEKYFTCEYTTEDIRLGVGDDSAILRIPLSMDLVVCTDTLVEGIHFSKDTPAKVVGYKALAVNLSDIAAMGAQPRWMSLALTLHDKTSELWVSGFAKGLKALAARYNVALIGGDITQGPVNCISVCLKGIVPSEQGILRSNGKNGDNLYITGSLGGAGYAWKMEAQGKHTHDTMPDMFKQNLDYPTPRIELGQHLREIATSMMDLSDGLVTDLPKLLKASKCGAKVNLNHLPMHPDLCHYTAPNVALALAMAGGDDYELCFTAPSHQQTQINTLAEQLNIPITCIGHLTAESDAIDYQLNGKKYTPTWQGWQHFGEQQ